MARDPDDILAPGVVIKEYGEIIGVPREYEQVMVGNFRYQVIEGGVFWNFVHDGVFVTITLVPAGTLEKVQEQIDGARGYREYQEFDPAGPDGA